jgi:hypothetical protein
MMVTTNYGMLQVFTFASSLVSRKFLIMLKLFNLDYGFTKLMTKLKSGINKETKMTFKLQLKL